MTHPCDFQPCEHGICERVSDMFYKCLCQPGFTGVNCHIPIQLCLNTTCLNGGSCRPPISLDDPLCDCPVNFTGNNCEINKIKANTKSKTCESDNPCFNGGICYIDQENQIACVCPIGFSGPLCKHKDNKSCQMCLNGGVCEFGDEDQSVKCQCPDGFTGHNCEQGNLSSNLQTKKYL